MEDFSQLYVKQVRSVYRLLLKPTGDAYTAEELTQQTFYKAFLHIGQFKGKCSLYTWLCTVGKKKWLPECRRRKIFPLDMQKEVGSGPGP